MTMALGLLAIGAALVFLVIIVPLAIWASISEAQELARTNRVLREWDFETVRLRQMYQRMSERRSGSNG